MRSIRLALVTAIAFLLTVANAFPQTSGTGIPPFATINIQNFDKLNVANYNVLFSILIAHRPGRGVSFDFRRTYNSAIWGSAENGQVYSPDPNYGWNSNSNPVTGSVGSTTTWYSCGDIDNNSYAETTYDYVDSTGADHPFDYKQITSTVSSTAACPSLSTAAVMINAKDGSGYVLAVDPSAGTAVVYGKHGTMYDNCHSRNSAGQCQAILIDSNGNEITEKVIDATHIEWYDAVNGSNAPVLKITYTDNQFGQAQTVQYDVSGVSNPYIEKYTASPSLPQYLCYTPVYGSSTTVPYELDLPNGQIYTFSYDNEAHISAITLPTGSVIHYSYSNSCTAGGPGHLSRWVDNQPAWQYDSSQAQPQAYTGTGPGPLIITETDPAGNQTQYSFNGIAMENQRKIYHGSVSGGTLLRTIDTCYNGASSPCINQSFALPVNEKSVTTTLDNGRQSRVNTYFDTTTYANVIEQDDYDLGASSPTRKTVNTYTGGNFPLLIDTKVRNGSGAQVADTGYSYDGGSLQPSGVTTQLTTPASGIPRGNLTGEGQWVGGSQYLTTSHAYYDTGQLYSTTDPNQNTTYYFYDTAYAGAWLTRIQRPSIGGTQYAVSFAYDPATGRMTSSTDENNNVTQYAYDEMGRPTVVNYPDGGETAYTYVDTPNAVSVEEQRLKDVGQPLSSGPDTIAYYDGQGRMVRRCSANGEATPEDRVDTTWDAMDRVQFQSYPYQAADCTSANSGEPGDTFAYDALGRPTTVTHSDGSQISYTYQGGATEVQDEGNGSSRVTHVYQNDGLGRLVSVCEVTSQTGAGSSSTPTACSNQIAGFPQDIAATGFETGYSYDLLGNLTGVQQPGLQDRTFSYDSLGRLLSASNPEAGATSYTYDADSNVLTRVRPAPNQTNPAVTVTTTYSYDALNRLLSKTYSDGTPTASFIYDWGSAAGLSLSNTVGRLALERTTNVGGTVLTEDIFSYDARGRVTSNWQDPGNGPLYPFAYGYDLLGDITQQSQPTDATATSFTLSGAWNRAGRLTGLTSSYPNSATHPSNLLSGVHYDAWGHVTARSTTNGAINETRRYDGRGRLWETRGNPYYVVWEQYYAPDGAVTTLEDAANGNWTYTYDALNRLLTANCSANCPGGQASLDLGWSYDRLGNRWSQTPTAGTASATSASFTGNNNRLDADSYDAAGNLLSDGSHTYTYDAENRIVGVDGNATASYAYDAAGRRVSTTVAGVTRLRFFDEQGRTVRRIDASGQWLSSEIYALGQPLATYDQSGANGMTWFMDVDPVGTVRTITNGSGQYAQACTSLPFGDGQACSPAISDPSPLHFTGKPRDAETGLDYFGFRYNSSTLGRFLTPDDPLIYASDEDPQTWNLYSYVGNNPINRIDPDGHLTIIVPGTHWNPNDWNMNMKLVQDAKRMFHDNDVRILPWSGDLGGGAIEAGATQLAAMVNGHNFRAGEKLNIIGHSRGGDVALQSAWHVNHKIDNLITLDTPVYNWHSPLSFPPGDFPLNKSNIGEWFDVMVTPDAVAPADSQLSTRWPATISVLVGCQSCNMISGHSASWANDQTRGYWEALWMWEMENRPCQSGWQGGEMNVCG